MGRVSITSLAGSAVEDVPGQSDPILVRLPLPKLVPTPLNPRSDFGTPDELTELGESMRRRQLQPVVVVARATYLKLYPEHAEAVGEASHVIANGERRYRAAKHIGLHSVEAVIREEVAASRQQFLDAVLSENIDRKNFDPMEEARGVEAMVAECGSATSAAEQFKRTSAWVSQRRVLLRLTPELQQLVSRREVPLREARDWGRLPAEQQQSAWETWRAERDAPRAKTKPETPPTDPPPVPALAPSGSDAPVVARPPAPREPTAPRQEGPPAGRPQPETPWGVPEAVARIIRKHMTAENRARLVKLLQE